MDNYTADDQSADNQFSSTQNQHRHYKWIIVLLMISLSLKTDHLLCADMHNADDHLMLNRKSLESHDYVYTQ